MPFRAIGQKARFAYIRAEMIYIENNTHPQWLRIPAAGAHEGDAAAVLALVCVLDKALKMALPFAVPAGVYQYAEGRIKLAEGLPEGDYTYTLTGEGRTLSQGVARVGAYKRHKEGQGITDFVFVQNGEN